MYFFFVKTRLTKTFLTLSLEDVASRAGLENSKEAEKYLVSMVESGEIFAKISHKDGMVKFGTKPEKYNSVEMLRKLEKHVAGIIDVTDRIDRNNFQKVPFHTKYVLLEHYYSADLP